MAVWMVRAGSQGEREEYNLENGIVSIGWDDIPNLSNVKTKESMRGLLEESYPTASKAYISNTLGQLWAFKERMQKEDIAVIPLKSRSGVALGKISGPYVYDKNGVSGTKHYRKVNWIKSNVPRDVFGQDLLYSLGAFMTVCQIQRNNADDRIKAILDQDKDPYLEIRPEKIEINSDENASADEYLADLEQYSLDLIRKYIGAKFAGHELTRLVAAVLKAQGYYTYVSPPGPDGGVDIIAGKGSMGFDHPRLCVQVKSSPYPVDLHDVRALKGVLGSFQAQQGLFVSWGGFKDSVYKEVRQQFFELRLWDADKLIQSLMEHYDQLSDVIQAELPLKRIWTLVPDEQKQPVS